MWSPRQRSCQKAIGKAVQGAQCVAICPDVLVWFWIKHRRVKIETMCPTSNKYSCNIAIAASNMLILEILNGSFQFIKGAGGFAIIDVIESVQSVSVVSIVTYGYKQL